MSSPDDMVGASAVNSYATVEAYELGKLMARTDHGARLIIPDPSATCRWDLNTPEARAFFDGYSGEWSRCAERLRRSSVDSSPVTNPRSKPDESPAEP